MNRLEVDIPRIINIPEGAHRIHIPITPEKLTILGAALRLDPGARVLDLGSGSGEVLCTWARDHEVIGTGIDMSRLFTEQARLRAAGLGVADRVTFIPGDASGYVADEKAGVAACVGASWIAGGVVGTIELLARSLCAGGIILIGEPYWCRLPPTDDIAKAYLAHSVSDFLAAKCLTMRRWLEANCDDELAEDVRARLTSEPARYAAYTHEYLGWGVFALMQR